MCLILKLSHTLLALFFIAAGGMHFISPNAYLAIMPPWIPSPRVMIAFSGAAEIAGGLGVLFPITRRLAAAGLIALLLAVFPANVQAAMHGMTVGGHTVAPWLLGAVARSGAADLLGALCGLEKAGSAAKVTDEFAKSMG